MRLWRVFSLLLSLYLLIKKRESFLGMKPLSPRKLRETITVLGTSFVKLAQVLATRSDFFSEEYLRELSQLHDDLPPMSDAQREAVFGRAFGSNPFVRFETVPIASASIGQVHEAWLDPDTKVAVKLRRQGIEKRVRADIRILGAFNRLFRPLFSTLTRHSIESVISEFSAMIVRECSFNQERRNLEKFSEMYADSGIIFPRPYPQWCSDDALVMSFEEGWRFDDRAAIEEAGIEISPIIERLVRFYTDQMLVRGFFHADPHPGNLLINAEGELILLDFGMVKRVPNDTRIAIIELIRSANERDFEGYVSAAKRLGTVAYDAPAAELAEFTERMFDIFGNESLDSSSMQKLAFDVLEQTRNLPFKLPQEAIYILRVSAIIEGLGTAYVENFNGIKDILPILQRNIPRALGMKESFLESVVDEFKKLPEDFAALRETLRRSSRGELVVELSSHQLQQLRTDLERSLAPLYTALVLGLAAIGGWMMGWREMAFVLLGGAIVRLWLR